MSETLLRVAAKAVILRDNKVLLVREASSYKDGNKIGQFGLVGGRIEADESFYDALDREIKEEVGLAVEPVRPVHVGEWWPNIEGQKNHIVAIFIHCNTNQDNIRLSDEHDSYLWVDLEGIQKLSVMEPDRTVVINFLSSLSA